MLKLYTDPNGGCDRCFAFSFYFRCICLGFKCQQILERLAFVQCHLSYFCTSFTLTVRRFWKVLLYRRYFSNIWCCARREKMILTFVNCI
uniref:Uncharacterized protein n=1 Tax=Rhipicephalus appendiculatus TaxID=34631 RepID=A0A131YEM2_RHIAP